MAKRGGGWSGLEVLVVGIFVIGGIAWVGIQAVHHWKLSVLALFGLGVLVYSYNKRKLKARERARREQEAIIEANRKAWRELTFESGSFSVVLSGFRQYGAEEEIASFLGDIPELREQSADEVEALVERVIHVSPQTVAEGIAQRDAVRLKEALELRGAAVKIKEGSPRRAAAGREPIPAHVRREVWRRDGGRCVDCGSRERLEFDHIIALANGGSNTVRNIELRCEPCNRKKAATI